MTNGILQRLSIFSPPSLSRPAPLSHACIVKRREKEMKKLPVNHSRSSSSFSFGYRIGRFYEPLLSTRRNAPSSSPEFTCHLLFWSPMLLPLFTTVKQIFARFPINRCQKFSSAENLDRSLSIPIVKLNVNLVIISVTFYVFHSLSFP